MIYFNNAATSVRRPPEVAQAVVQAMNEGASVSRGTGREGEVAGRTVYSLREEVAAFFGFGEASRVIFTSNATEALNTALLGMFEAGDHVISTDLEHNSVLRPLGRLQSEGVRVSFVRADRQGRISLEELESLIEPQTKAIVTTHVSNVTGNVVDIESVAKICHRHSIFCIVDAAQSAGSLEIKMDAMGIDVLCFTGHKGLMGPQGTGGLLVREGVVVRPLKEGGTGIRSFDERQPAAYPEHLEAGTLNIHGLAGLRAAILFIQKIGLSEIWRKEQQLMRQFYESVVKIDGVTIYGDFEAEHAGIVTLNIEGVAAAEVADLLTQKYGISVRAGAHCAPRMHRALGTDAIGAVRFSFGYWNTEEEVEVAVRAVSEIAGAVRKGLKLKIVVTFPSTHDAIKAEAVAASEGVKGRLIPVPTDISAGCGMAFMMLPGEEAAFRERVATQVDTDGFYCWLNSDAG